jgi:hypothetical protein
MTAATAAKTAEKPDRSERGLSYKDVQILFLSDGLAKIEKFYKGGLISSASMKKAAKAFQVSKTGDTFQDFVEAHVCSIDGRRGRRAPATGGQRQYRAQQIGKGGLFIRLPVTTLANSKGDALVVSFDDGVITVKADD